MTLESLIKRIAREKTATPSAKEKAILKRVSILPPHQVTTLERLATTFFSDLHHHDDQKKATTLFVEKYLEHSAGSIVEEKLEELKERERAIKAYKRELDQKGIYEIKDIAKVNRSISGAVSAIKQRNQLVEKEQRTRSEELKKKKLDERIERNLGSILDEGTNKAYLNGRLTEKALELVLTARLEEEIENKRAVLQEMQKKEKARGKFAKRRSRNITLLDEGLENLMGSAYRASTVLTFMRHWDNLLERRPASKEVKMWVASLQYISDREEKPTFRDEAIRRYLHTTTNKLIHYHEEYGSIFARLSEPNNILGAEDFLFTTTLEQKLSAEEVNERVEKLGALSRRTKEGIRKIREKIKRSDKDARHVDAKLYELFTYEVPDAERKREIVAETIDTIASGLQSPTGVLSRALPSLTEIFKKDSAIVTDRAEEIKRAAAISQATLQDYMHVLDKISDFENMHPVESKLYAELPFVIYSERSGQEASGRAIKVIEKMRELPAARRNEVITRLREIGGEIFTKKGRKGINKLYSEEFFSGAVNAVQVDEDKALAFIEEISNRYNPKNEQERTALRPILESMPAVLPVLEVDDFRESLMLLQSKNATTTVKRRGEKMDKFPTKLFGALGSMDTAKARYCIQEIRRIQGKVYSPFRDGAIDLEEIILNSVTANDGFSEEQTTRLNTLFANVYDGSRISILERYANAEDSVAIFRESLQRIPEKYRDIAIETAEEIVAFKEADKPSEKPDVKRAQKRETLKNMNQALKRYAQALEEVIPQVGDNFPQWTKRLLAVNSTSKELIDYLEDPHGYYEEELDNVSEGLALSSVQERLRTYAQSLTGRNIDIKRADSQGLTCSFDGTSFLLPRSVNISNDERENFGIYKALTSYQAAAIAFGTYDFDRESLSEEAKKRLGEEVELENVLTRFENPEVAKTLFDMFELSRLDARLIERFPGLRKDLTRLKRKAGAEETAEDIEAVSGALSRLRQYSLTEESSGLPSKLKKATKEIAGLREKTSSVAQTINTVESVYSILESMYDLTKPYEQEEETVRLNLETIIEEEASYLVAGPSLQEVEGKKYRYDEWDAEEGAYKKEFVQVISAQLGVKDNNYIAEVMERDGAVVERLREHFELIKPEEYTKVRGQTSGKIDYAALVRAYADIEAGITPSEKLFDRTRKNNRSVTSMVLSEMSGSLGRFIDLKNPNQRLIDIIKQTQFYFAEALDVVDDPYALAVFSGESERNVQFFTIKDFSQAYDDRVRQSIGSLRPMQQNRDGAGIRHATDLLSQQSEKTKILFYLMEGAPHDFGYEKEYAIEDTKKALIEASSQGCTPVVLAYGSKIDDAVRSISEHVTYREISDPKETPALLPRLYEKMTLV